MSHGPTMSQAVYVLGSQTFDPMWEEACADAWRTDTYLNVYRDALCVSEIYGWLTYLARYLSLVSVIIVGFVAVTVKGVVSVT